MKSKRLQELTQGVASHQKLTTEQASRSYPSFPKGKEVRKPAKITVSLFAHLRLIFPFVISHFRTGLQQDLMESILFLRKILYSTTTACLRPLMPTPYFRVSHLIIGQI